MKSIGSDAAVSLRSKHNTKRLISFHFEDDVSSVFKYNGLIVRIATVASSFPLYNQQILVKLSYGDAVPLGGFKSGLSNDNREC